MKYTKEDIVTEYKKIREHLGCAPSSTVFYKESGIHKRHLDKHFGSNAYSKLVIECGDIPKDFSHPKSDFDKILLQYGELARKLNKLPTSGDWIYAQLKPSISGIEQSHNLRWGEMPNKFFDFAASKDEWSDVIILIPRQSKNGISDLKSVPKIEGLNFEHLKFVPPVVQDLVDLSINEEKAREFEKSVNLVFQMLGFEVLDYGQGTGRNPDGVAKENHYRYAILIDAKARKENYKIGTDDRKFIEYIKTFSEPLRKSGFTNIYFLIVSSSFDSLSTTAIKNIRVETQVPTILLTSRLLLKILSSKIRSPRLFDLKKFQELLIEDGELTDKKIDKLITGLK